VFNLVCSTWFNLGVAEYALNGFKRAACGGADVAESVALLMCPLGPIPLAARGLTAVLARAGPAGGDSRQRRFGITLGGPRYSCKRSMHLVCVYRLA
jgi:hypothetical protein